MPSTSLWGHFKDNEMSKPTPGPWHAVYNKKMGWYAICTSRPAEYGGTNLVVRVEDYQPGEKETNAHLIAAAPELLEALKVFAVHFGPLEDNEMLHPEARRCFALARAAIAKTEVKS